MRSFFTYLRRHPWQRRAITLVLAGVLGIVAAAFFLPRFQQYIADRRLVAQLASPDSKERIRAIYRAQKLAKENSATLNHLREALDTGDDRLFSALVNVLRSVGDTASVTNPPERIDRLLAIEMETTRSADTRRIIFMPALLAGRDNAYVRRALKSASADPIAEIRAMSSVLAAKLADDATLLKLMGDSDSSVQARAALDAGLAGRPVADQLESLLQTPEVEVSSCAAYALALYAEFATTHKTADQPATVAFARKHVPKIVDRLEQTKDPALRARLVHVLAMVGRPTATGAPAARDAVAAVVAAAEKDARLLSTAELIACNKLGLTQAQEQIRKILQLAGRRDPAITVPQALAAMDSAVSFKMPVRAEIYAICENLWTADGDFVILLSHAARALGAQAALPQGDRGETPSTQDCVRLLQSMARYSVESPQATSREAPLDKLGTRPASAAVSAFVSMPVSAAASSPTTDAVVELTTPLPSAAAAVALWELAAELSDEFVREASVDQKLVVGDYISWNLSQGPQPGRAFDLGLAMLPEMTGQTKVYSANERACGAMLLALSARSQEQISAGRSRLLPRLASQEPDVLAKGSYRCAMLILGEGKLLDDVRLLLEMGFPQRRVLTALWCSGDQAALDWLLWNPQMGPKDISDALVLRGCNEVLRATAPELPPVDSIDPAGNDDLQLWQIQILRDDYAIHRQAVRLSRGK